MNASIPDKFEKFQVHPYKRDGVTTAGGSLTLLAIVVTAGISIGFVVIIAKSFGLNVFLLTPLFCAFLIGFPAAYGAKVSKVRNLPAIITVSLFAGLTSFLIPHTYEYYRTENELKIIPSNYREVACNFEKYLVNIDSQEPEVQELIEYLRNEPVIRKRLAVKGFFGFMKFNAEKGLVISESAPNGQIPSETVYSDKAQYAYWIFEFAIVSLGAFIGMYLRSSVPICRKCESWKPVTQKIELAGDSAMAKDALTSGELERVLSCHLPGNPELMRLDIFSCQNCGSAEDFEAKLVRLTDPNRIGNHVNARGDKEICLITFPSDARRLLASFHYQDRRQQAAKAVLDMKDMETGKEMILFGKFIQALAILIFLGSTIASFIENELWLVGFAISPVVFICGFGLTWVGRRQIH